MPKKIYGSGMNAGSPFFYMLRASGHGEVWSDSNEEAKFRQFGWRCSTNEENYSASTLIGNWYENRFDPVRAKALCRPLTSQFSHYYDTTYSSTFKKEEETPLNSSFKKELRSLPGHQPDLDPPQICTPGGSQTPDFTLVNVIQHESADNLCQNCLKCKISTAAQ